jgi:biopolymer transport protein ExbB
MNVVTAAAGVGPVGLMLAAEEATSGSAFQHFVIAGGWITWFLLIPLSIATVALTIHYLLTIRRKTQVPPSLAHALVTAASRGEAAKLIETAGKDETMLGVAAFAGASQIRAGRDAARAAVDEAVEERATKLFRRIEYLNVIGNVSPMIGLLGTVLGMIQAFNRIFAAGGGMPDAGKLAGDIAVALVTTFWGLIIAIPALTTFAIFRNRIDAFAAECIKLCDGLLGLTVENSTTGAVAAASRSVVAPRIESPAPPVKVV